jgi:four helix bundle protein
VCMHSSHVVISRFEDIESWRRARELSAEVYGISTKGAFSKDFGLHDQIQRACVSIMANIAEGFGRYGATEFIRYLTIAQSSAIEVQSHLYIAIDLYYISQPGFERLYGLVESVRKLIGGFIRYLETTKNQKLETRN